MAFWNKKTDKTEDKPNIHNAADAARFLKIFEFLQKARKGFEIENFINNNYYRNQHYVKYNLQLNKLETVPNTKLGSRISLNRVKEKCTQAVAFLTKDEPRVDVQPAGGQEASDEIKARIDSERNWCDYQYKVCEIPRKERELALEGAIYSLGWFKVGYDPYKRVPLADGTELYGDVTIDVAPWWHVYFDPIAKDMEHMRYLAFAEQRSVGELKRKYPNAKALVPNQVASPSDYEARILNQMFRYAPLSMQPDDENSVTTIIELYYWQWKTIKQEGFDGDFLEKQLWMVVLTKDGLMLEHVRAPHGDFFPLEPFMWDTALESIQTEGLVKNIRQPNKAENTLITSLIEYATKFKGKILEPRTANIVTLNDEHGERVQYDLAGGKPEYWPVPPINPAVNQGITYLDMAIDDLSMIHNQFSGDSGGSGESGYHAEIIASGDAQSFMVTKNNLDTCLQNTFKKALKIAKIEYEKQGLPRALSVPGMEQERFMISGQDINVDDDITVTTQANFALTKRYMFDELKQLYQLQAIDKQTLLEAYKFSDIQTILDRLTEEQNGESPDNQVAMAVLENRLASSGKTPPDPQPGQNHSIHMAVHGKYLKSDEVGTNQTIKQLMVEHMNKTEQLMQQEQQEQSMSDQGVQVPPPVPGAQPTAQQPAQQSMGMQPPQQQPPQQMPQQAQPLTQPQ